MFLSNVLVNCSTVQELGKSSGILVPSWSGLPLYSTAPVWERINGLTHTSWAVVWPISRTSGMCIVLGGAEAIWTSKTARFHSPKHSSFGSHLSGPCSTKTGSSFPGSCLKRTQLNLGSIVFRFVSTEITGWTVTSCVFDYCGPGRSSSTVSLLKVLGLVMFTALSFFFAPGAHSSLLWPP